MKIPHLIDYDSVGNPLYYSQSARQWHAIPTLYLQAYETHYDSDYPCNEAAYNIAILCGIGRLLNVIGRLNRQAAFIGGDDRLHRHLTIKAIYEDTKAYCLREKRTDVVALTKQAAVEVLFSQVERYYLSDKQRSIDISTSIQAFIATIQSAIAEAQAFIVRKLEEAFPVSEDIKDTLCNDLDNYYATLPATKEYAMLRHTVVQMREFVCMWYDGVADIANYGIRYEVKDLRKWSGSPSVFDNELKEARSYFEAFITAPTPQAV